MTYIADDFNAIVASHAGMSSQKIACMVKRRLPCIVRSNIRPAYLWIQLFKRRQSVLFNGGDRHLVLEAFVKDVDKDFHL